MQIFRLSSFCYFQFSDKLTSLFTLLTKIKSKYMVVDEEIRVTALALLYDVGEDGSA